jgi:hypothetical protein
VPTHYTIRTNWNGPGWNHLKSWLVETSVDGKSWRDVAREEDNERLNGKWFTGTFAVARGGECRFIRLVNIGKNHYGDDQLLITAQSQCLTIITHWSTIMVIRFHHRANKDTTKNLPSAVLVSLLKPSVDVLWQHSLPYMDLRRATYLTIALLPNHETTSADASLDVPVRPPFRRCLPRGQRPPPLQCPVPSGRL